MECSNLGYQIWAIAIYLWTTNLKGISSMHLHRDLDVTQRTAWYLLHRIRQSLTPEQLTLFEDTVEVDETYIGGKKATNMPKTNYAPAEGQQEKYLWLA